VRFCILGPLEVSGSSGVPVSISAPKHRALLAILLLHANHRVSAGRLESALWPGRPPRSAAGMLRTYVSGLRQSLGLTEPGVLPSLATRPGGYELTVAPADLDMSMFDELSARGRQALDRGGDPLAATRLLRAALGLWRGEPAEGIDLGQDTETVVAGLRERRLAVEEAWVRAQFALGDDRELVLRLTELAVEHPFRERLHSQLMLALYRAGRQAEALDVFQALRRRLAAELGTEPSLPVRRLHERILRGDPELTPPVRSWLRGLGQSVAPRQLPSGTAEFTGRLEHLDRLDAIAKAGSAAPLVMISGMAGSGKTTLAVHWAHRRAGQFPDGQLFVDLQGHSADKPMEPTEALRRFLRGLGTAPDQIPHDEDEAATLYRSLLAGKRVLIVADNAGSAGQVRPLLPGTPGCLVLITSRSRLPGLVARSGATPVTLGPLSEAEAVSLLRTLLGDARVDAEPPAAAQIAARCAFLPLAVRIAAERAAHRPRLSLTGLAGELAAERDRLDALTAGEDGDTTVRSVFSWSYRGLRPAAARMFRLLSLHPGADISIPAAAALADVSVAGAARLLEALAEVHLLEETAPGRYRLHDLLRAYAAERADQDETPQDRDAAIARMLTWCLHTLVAADRVLMPGRRHICLTRPPRHCEPLAFAGYEQALAWADAEHTTLVGAVSQAAQAGCDDIAWQLVLAMGSYMELRKPWTEWIACSRVGRAAAIRAGNRWAEGWILNALACAHGDLRQFDEEHGCLQRALVIVQEIGDRKGEVATTNNLGEASLRLNRVSDALDYLSSSLDIARDIGERYGESVTLGSLGDVYRRIGRAAEALDCYKQALTLARETGDLRIEGLSLNNLANAYHLTGQLDEATGCYEQALAVRQRAGDRQGEAESLRDFGDFLQRGGQAKRAHQCWHGALAIFGDLGDAQAGDVRRRLADTPVGTVATA
jgi:DNA-binding SARP family transcriptional activator/tetratricopeptide (TPR) repeat protein